MAMRFFHSDHVALPVPEGHRFPSTKYRLLREALLARGRIDADRIEASSPIEWDELAVAHDPAYLQSIREGTVAPAMLRRIGFPWSPGLVERSRHSVGGTWAATRSAMETGAGANLAGGTHHAFADRGEGYCVFNDLAVSIRLLQRARPGVRCAVVDLDVHQGNGTAAMLAGDPDVFTLSLHGRRNFPFHKERSSLDVELEDGCDDTTYLAALDRSLGGLAAFRPTFIFYLAGADVLAEDTLGHLSLTLDGVKARDARVLDFVAAQGAKVVMVMGGGYAKPIERTVEAHVASFEALYDFWCARDGRRG